MITIEATVPGEVDDVEVVGKQRLGEPTPRRLSSGERRHLDVEVGVGGTQAMDHFHHALAGGKVVRGVLDSEDPHRRILDRQITPGRWRHTCRDHAPERRQHQWRVVGVEHHLPRQVEHGLVDHQQQCRAIEVGEQPPALRAEEHVTQRATEIAHRRRRLPAREADAAAPTSQPVDRLQHALLVVAASVALRCQVTGVPST